MNSLDAESLIRAKRDLPLPFKLSIEKFTDKSALAEPSEVTVHEVLRLLPGKRVAAIASNGEDRLFIKVFVGPSARRYWKREINGVAAIEAAGVATPKLLWKGRLPHGGYALAFEYIEHTASLAERWDPRDNALCDKVMSLLARLHDNGVTQNDIHPGNFLISDDEIYVVDGGDIGRKELKPLSQNKTLKNLALFLAQFHKHQELIIENPFRFYRAHRGWARDREVNRKLHRYIMHCRNERKEAYIKKAFRECTRFTCSQTFSRFRVCERQYKTPELIELLDHLDEAIAAGELIKDGNTATVAKIDSPLGPLVVKRYNMKNPWHRFTRAFRKSRAWISWANTYRLEFLGIGTLQPIALVEDRLGPLRGKAYFVTRYVEAPDATRIMEVDDLDATMGSIVDLLKELNDSGITHGDLKANNFLLIDDEVKIIDLDSMRDRGHSLRFEVAFKKDMERFMRNWETPPLKHGFKKLLSLEIPGAA